MARFFSQKDIDEFKECFFLYARRGYVVDDAELSLITRSLGFSVTAEETERYYTKYSKDGKIDFATFLELLYEHSKIESAEKEIVAAFEATDTAKRGYVTSSEFRHILTSFGEKLTKKEVDSMLKEAGVPPGGKVKYIDLIKTMMTPVPDY
ncbi:calmodulin-like protein 4 [Tubulanus polymorphus]|uniref:calmodulin-like protein 4 n=1 Tax=Tubulanus polymorphus TaxID=672921 RepID=UPI003DA4175E